MVDQVNSATRRRIMQSVGTRNTGPEIQVRKALYRQGYRYRLHRRDLPGSPDIVLPGKRKIVLVHGCYWHGHGCAKGKLPKSRVEYWSEKIAANKARDAANLRALRRLAWSVIVVWQCELRNIESVTTRLDKFLSR